MCIRDRYLYSGDDKALTGDYTMSLDDEETLSFTTDSTTLTLPDASTIASGKFVRKYITTGGVLYIPILAKYLYAESCVLIGTHNGWGII